MMGPERVEKVEIGPGGRSTVNKACRVTKCLPLPGGQQVTDFRRVGRVIGSPGGCPNGLGQLNTRAKERLNTNTQSPELKVLILKILTSFIRAEFYGLDVAAYFE